MKIIKLFAAASAALGLLASCQQQEVENLTNQEELVPVSLTASFSTAETKVSYTETATGGGIQLQPAWTVNDKVIGFDGENNTYTFTVSEIDGSGVATLDGECPASCTLHLIYLCGASASSISSGSLSVSYESQAGTGSTGNVYTMPAVMLADGEVAFGSGDFHFSNAGAVIGVSAVKGVPSGTTISEITVSGEDLSAATIELDGSVNKLKLTATPNDDDAISTATLSGVTVTDDDGTLSELVLIALPAGAKVARVTVAAGVKTYSFTLGSAVELAAGTYPYINGSSGQAFTEDVVPVTGLSFDFSSKDMTVGESFTAEVTVTPAGATGYTVNWSSDNTSVATVDENGQVTAVGAGTAIITATVGGQTATFTVTVAPAVGYVEIEAKYDGTNVTTLKWATQNLSISESGSKSWKGTSGNTSAVKVPGTDEDVKVGDYFQWAAYEDYCVDASVDDKGLLIYKSFTNEGCGDSNSITLKFTGKSFASGNAPYYTSSAYEKYTSSSQATLVETDDVAHIILGGNWRMPTSAEFKAMREATYWAWDSTDQGYYVFSPDASHAAGGRASSIPSGLSKSNALLFFPAAGYGYNGSFTNVGSYGNFWSSSFYSSNTSYAYYLYFSGSGVNPQDHGYRYCGRSVRPVSD